MSDNEKPKVLICSDQVHMKTFRKLLSVEYGFINTINEFKVKPDDAVTNPFIGKCNINHRK